MQWSLAADMLWWGERLQRQVQSVSSLSSSLPSILPSFQSFNLSRKVRLIPSNAHYTERGVFTHTTHTCSISGCLWYSATWDQQVPRVQQPPVGLLQNDSIQVINDDWIKKNYHTDVNCQPLVAFVQCKNKSRHTFIYPVVFLFASTFSTMHGPSIKYNSRQSHSNMLLHLLKWKIQNAFDTNWDETKWDAKKKEKRWQPWFSFLAVSSPHLMPTQALQKLE